MDGKQDQGTKRRPLPADNNGGNDEMSAEADAWSSAGTRFELHAALAERMPCAVLRFTNPGQASPWPLPGATMPRSINPSQVEDAIASEVYFTAQQGHQQLLSDARITMPLPGLELIVFCVMILRNGHRVIGVSQGPLDAETNDRALGKEIARDHAIKQIYELLAYDERQAALDVAKITAASKPIERGYDTGNVVWKHDIPGGGTLHSEVSTDPVPSWNQSPHAWQRSGDPRDPPSKQANDNQGLLNETKQLAPFEDPATYDADGDEAMRTLLGRDRHQP